METFPERLRKRRELEGWPQPPGARGQVSPRGRHAGEDVTGRPRSRRFQRNAASSGSEVLAPDSARREPRAPPVTTLEVREGTSQAASVRGSTSSWQLCGPATSSGRQCPFSCCRAWGFPDFCSPVAPHLSVYLHTPSAQVRLGCRNRPARNATSRSLRS